MQSVASISPPDPVPTPAPDRKDKGSDSFSLLLDATAKQPDHPAPEAARPAGDEPPSAPRKTESRPADDRSAQPQDDSGKANASGERGDASKAGDAAAKAKDSGKGAKQSANDDGAKDPAQAVAAPDPAQSLPQAGAAPAVVVAVDAPKAEDVASTGDCAKAAAADAAAVPVASGAPDTPKPSAGTTPPAKEGAAQAAAIEAAAKGASEPSDPPAESDDASKAPNIPRSGAIAALAEKAAPRAAEVAAAVNLGEPNPKTPATDKASSGNTPIQPAPLGAEEDKPLNPGDAASAVRLTAKTAPDSRTLAPAGASQDAAAVMRDVSTPPQLAPSAALPEPLRVLASALGPASTPIQTPGAVPPTSAAIAVEIAAHAKDGSNRFDIRLDPPELGRIDVHLDVGKGGEVSTRLTVDRPETLQILQNDARGLERALQSAGLKTEDGSLQFSLRQQSPDGSSQQAQGGTEPRSGAVYVAEDESAGIGVEQYQWAARLRGGVDIRV